MALMEGLEATLHLWTRLPSGQQLDEFDVASIVINQNQPSNLGLACWIFNQKPLGPKVDPMVDPKGPKVTGPPGHLAPSECHTSAPAS